jgi:HEAT repeat protein
MEPRQIDDLLNLLKSSHLSERRTALEQVMKKRIDDREIASEVIAISNSDPNEDIRHAAQQIVEELGLEMKKITFKTSPELEDLVEIRSSTDRLLAELVKEQSKIQIDLYEQTRYLKSIASGVNIIVAVMLVILILGIAGLVI